MSNQDKLLDLIAEQALEWHVRHREGEMSAAARVEFMEWLRASPLNVNEYLEIARLTRELPGALAAVPADMAEALRVAESATEGSLEKVVPLANFRLPPAEVSVRRRSTVRWVAAAATVVLSLSLYTYLWGWGHAGLLGLVPITSQNEQRTVALRDGSRVHLDAHSRVQVRFSAGERLLDLEAGQALFDVAHDRSRPFRVRAGAADIVAVGTRFDVDRRATALTVTVVEGKVDIVERQPPAAASNRTTPVEPLRVSAGQRVEVSPQGKELHAQATDVRAATAWMRRDIAFSARRLAEVTEELNRYIEKPIVIQDEALRELRVSGIFNAYDSESFLAFLRQYDVEIDARDDVIYVRSRAKSTGPNRQVAAGR